MDSNAVEQKLKEILVNKLHLDAGKIKPEASLRDDLAMDSFAAVEVIFEIEEAFNISVPQDATANIHTIKDMIDIVVKLTESKQG